MRATYLLAFIALTAFACGGNDNAAVDTPPEAIKTTGVTGGTFDEPAVLFVSTKEAIAATIAVVPPESGIEHEGVVWLEVRTVNTVIDTAWVIVTSGFAEVDAFALNHVLTKIGTRKVGWGDPPFKMQVFVRLPADVDEQEELTPKLDTAELGVMPAYAFIPPGSDIEHEGDVLVVFHVVEDLVDTVRVVESSGYPEVDEFAMKYLMTYNQYSPRMRRLSFEGLENDLMKARIFVRRQQ